MCSTCTLSNAEPVNSTGVRGMYTSEDADNQLTFLSETSVYSTDQDQDRLSVTDGKLSRNVSRESKLLQYFSKVVAPEQVMEWIVKRSKLNQLIYSQSDKCLKSTYKLELDAGMGHNNPKAMICIYPYGCEDDVNEFVTLEVRLKTSPRSKCLKMHSESKIVVKACAEDEDGHLIGSVRKKEDYARFSYFYIKRFIRHIDLKMSHSENIHFMFSCSFIGGDCRQGECSSWSQQ